MNKKWSSEKVKETQRWLIKRWPESFTQGPDLRPLSLQIHKEILKFRDENPQLSSRVVREVLKRHTTSYGYLYGLVKHAKRYDLEGNPVGEVSGEHREWASATLKHKQKEAQRIRKEARRQLKEQQRVTRRAERKDASDGASDRTNDRTSDRTNDRDQPRSSAGAGSPVIRYKQPKRRMVKPASADRAVDLAS